MSLSHAILGILTAGPRHGYALQRKLDSIAGSFWSINQGQVYATLGRLERAGLVLPLAPRSGKFDDKELRRYRLTAQGRRQWQIWLDRPERLGRNDGLGFDDWIAHLAVCERRSEQALLAIIIDLQRRRCRSLQRARQYRGESETRHSFASQAAAGILEAELRWLDLAESMLVKPTTSSSSSSPETNVAEIEHGKQRTTAGRT